MAEDGWLDCLWSALDAAVPADARQIVKIFQGTKPGRYPGRSRRIELVINLKTAKALGLTVPQSMLPRADEVIEWGGG